MVKNEIVEGLKEYLGYASKKEVSDLGAEIEKVVAYFTEHLPEKDKANFGGIKFENKLVKGRSGEMKMKDGTVKPWTTEDHYEVKAKIK